MDPILDEESQAMGIAMVETQMQSLSTEELEQLAEAIKTAEEQAKAERAQVLDALATTISSRRDEAIRNRSACGIEDEWEEDEEQYEGVDDANREEEGRHRTRKPLIGASIPKSGANRSTVFLNITRPFVDSASARVGDMLLPTDDRSWQYKPTPLPDDPKEVLSLLAKEQQPPPMPMGMPPQQFGGMPPQMPMQPGMQDVGMQQGMPPGMPPQQPPPPPDPEVQMEEARKKLEAVRAKKVERGQRQVEDWLTESNFPGQMRRGFDDCAKIGSMVIKGPFPTLRDRQKWEGEAQIKFTEIVPDCKHIDPWNFFPDYPACGENIHNGRFVFELDHISSKVLYELRDDPSYFPDQIDEVLKEGPVRHTAAGRIEDQQSTAKEKQYESWIFYGNLEREDLEVLGMELGEDAPIQIPVLAQMVNDRIIKIAQSPLDSGRFPYHLMPWSKRKGMPWGRGVARQVRTPQRMINAATRNMMDNAGLAAGVILVLKRRGITPSDNNWELHGRKTFWCDDTESASKAARDAIASVEIPIRVNELMAIINFALKMAEDVTGMPMLLQGQQGDAPDTVGGMTILNNNASGVMRRVARSFDDYVTEPMITMYYDWLQQYTDDPQMRFDAIIDARGSTALVERDLQNQWITQMAQFVLNPAFRIDPAKWFEEYSKSVRFDPQRIQYSDADWEALQSQPPPKDPRVEAAELQKAARVEAAQVQAGGYSARAQAEAQGRIGAATVTAQANERIASLEAEVALSKQQMSDVSAREREIIKLLGEERMTAQEIKSRLLGIVTQSRDKRDLFAAEAAMKERSGSGI